MFIYSFNVSIIDFKRYDLFEFKAVFLVLIFTKIYGTKY